MRNDAWLKIRVPTPDLESWKAEAVGSGVLFSEWVRETLNVAISDNGAVPEGRTGVGAADTVAAPPKPKKAVKTCVHGKERGFNCWQCGGMAKVE